MSSNKPFPSSDLDVFKENSLILDNFVNSQENEYPDRFARKRPTITGIIKEAFNVRTDISNMNETLIGQSRWDTVPKNTSLSLGGDNGALNKQAQALFNRTEMLKVHTREALRRTYQEVGLNLVEGSFEEGGTLNTVTDILLEEKTGKVYSWTASFPKVVNKLEQPMNEFKQITGIKESVQLKWFCIGDGITDDTLGLQRAIDYAFLTNLPLFINKGTYKYSQINLRHITSGAIIKGEGPHLSKLVYVGIGNAFVIDAFHDSNQDTKFINNIVLTGFSILGEMAPKLLSVHGVARSKFTDIRVNGSSVENTGSVGVELKGVMLSTFERVMCSYEFGPTPYRGLVLEEGRRASVSVGGCSNNVFTSCYMEGLAIGIQIKDHGGDQNTFVGGSPESCSKYGLIVGENCRYNTFVGVGFENIDSTSDVIDMGISSEYINCYSSQSFIVEKPNRSIRVRGGFFERIQINNETYGQCISDITINHWNTGAGGIFNNGVGLKFSNIWDSQTKRFIYPLVERLNITVGNSPYTIVNDELVPIKFKVSGSGVELVQILRNNDFWVEQNPTDSGGGTVKTGIYTLLPGEELKLTFSSPPSVNKILLNNL